MDDWVPREDSHGDFFLTGEMVRQTELESMGQSLEEMNQMGIMGMLSDWVDNISKELRK